MHKTKQNHCHTKHGGLKEDKEIYEMRYPLKLFHFATYFYEKISKLHLQKLPQLLHKV